MAAERDPIQALPLLQSFASALNISAIYPPEHPNVMESVTRVVAAHQACLRERDGADVTFLVIGQELLVDERPLRAHDQQVRPFVRAMNRQSIERMTLGAGLDAEECRELVGGLASGWGVQASRHVVLGHVEVQEGGAASPDTADHEKAGGARAGGGLSESDVDQAEDLFLRFQGDRRGSIEQLDKVLWHFVEGLEQTSRTLLLLAPQHASDQRLFSHSLNVSLLALAQARALGIGGQTLHDIGLGALLHDIGKLSLPRALLERSERLSDREWEIFKHHPELGAAQLCGVPSAPPLAILVAYEHHLRWDGKPSYPVPAAPRAPNLASQLTAIADTYDTMIASRGILGGVRGAAAMKVWQERSGSYLDPLLVANFVLLVSDLEVP